MEVFTPLLISSGVIVALLLVAMLAVRWWGYRFRSLAKKGQRLSVIDAIGVDVDHRLVLVRRDDKEHLILIGRSGVVLIESDIMAGSR